MVVRLKWFVFGVVVTLGIMAYAISRLRALRERVSPGAVAREIARGAAAVLEAAAGRVAPTEPWE